MSSKELIAELRGKKWMVNCEMRGLIPDDTAERAAAHIAAQDARIEALEGDLHFYADDHVSPSDGPWGVNSGDYGVVARKALGGEQHGG